MRSVAKEICYCQLLASEGSSQQILCFHIKSLAKEICLWISVTISKYTVCTCTHVYMYSHYALFTQKASSASMTLTIPQLHFSNPLLLLSVSLCLACWVEVTGTFSQGCLCLRSGILMPGWLSGTDSSVPVGDHQTFSDSDHRPPVWIGLMCIFSLLGFTAVH